MATYVIRRVLYSIPVLIAASFLIFSFVTLSGDPIARIKLQPRQAQAGKEGG